MKTLFKTIPFLVVLTALVACSGGLGGETATIIIDLGSPASSKEAVNVAELSHTVVLSGPSGSRTLSISGNGRASASVAPGLWVISVTAYYQGAVYAIGSASVEVRAYQTASVTVFMTVVWGEETQGGGGGGGPSQPSLSSVVDKVAIGFISTPPSTSLNTCVAASSLYAYIESAVLTTADVDWVWKVNGVPVVDLAGTIIIGTNNDEYTVPATDEHKKLTATASLAGYGGEITSEVMYVCKELDTIEWPVFSGSSFGTTNYPADGNYVFTVTIPPTVSIPIGDGTTPTPFTGYFDGNEETINLNIATAYTGAEKGLFAHVGSNGVVKNLMLTGSITGTGTLTEIYAGAVTGVNDGSVINISSTAIVNVNYTGGIYAGGLAGLNNGKIRNCYSTGDVTASISIAGSQSYVGGITGNNKGKIEFCWAIGDIDSTNGGTHFLGGIAGITNSVMGITNCVAINGTLTSTNGTSSLARVTGTIESSGSVDKNYANSSMTMNGVTISSGTAQDEYGEGVDYTNPSALNDAMNPAWWITPGWIIESTGSEDSPWEWDIINSCPKLWF